jgi:flagellar protein FlaJ
LSAKGTKAVKGESQGLFRSFWRFAYTHLDSRMGRFYKMFGSMEDAIRRSGIRLTYRVYVCGMIFSAILAFVILFGASLVIVLVAPVSLAVRIVVPIMLGIVGGAITLGVQFIRPSLKAGGRRKRIDEELAYVVGRMAVLAASGMTPESIIKQIAEDDSNDMLIMEFRKIVRDMSMLGMDLDRALQEARRRSASDMFSAFLDGMVSTSNSGADIDAYLLKQSKTLMNDKRLKAKQFSETLGVVAEMYTTLLVVMPLILIILFAVMGVIVGSLGGLTINLLIELVVYVLVPFGGIMMMVLADSMMPRR